MNLQDAHFSNVDRNLVFDFVYMFSRFEYALKRIEEFRKGDEKGVAADWDRFASKYETSFDPNRTEELKVAFDYISENPPKKQILKNGKIHWDTVCSNSDPQLKRTLLSIRTVRNNLFHGGKYGESPVKDVSRTPDLLKNSIIILKDCLELNTKIKEFFNGSTE